MSEEERKSHQFANGSVQIPPQLLAVHDLRNKIAASEAQGSRIGIVAQEMKQLISNIEKLANETKIGKRSENWAEFYKKAIKFLRRRRDVNSYDNKTGFILASAAMMERYFFHSILQSNNKNKYEKHLAVANRISSIISQIRFCQMIGVIPKNGESTIASLGCGVSLPAETLALSLNLGFTDVVSDGTRTGVRFGVEAEESGFNVVGVDLVDESHPELAYAVNALKPFQTPIDFRHGTSAANFLESQDEQSLSGIVAFRAAGELAGDMPKSEFWQLALSKLKPGAFVFVGMGGKSDEPGALKGRYDLLQALVNISKTDGHTVKIIHPLDEKKYPYLTWSTNPATSDIVWVSVEIKK